MDTVNKEWNVKVDFITFYKFSVTALETILKGTLPTGFTGNIDPTLFKRNI